MTAGAHKAKRLKEDAWMAMLEAIAVFYWWKKDLERFLRSQLKDCPEILARLSFGETKRHVAAEVVGLLSRYEDQYQGVALDLLVELAGFDEEFRHLRRCEDPEPKVADAQAALAEVRRVVDTYSAATAEREQLRRDIEKDAAAAQERRSHDGVLAELLAEFMAMYAMNDTPQARGKRFEDLLRRLFGLYDLNPRAAYDLDHEQIDGAFTFRTDDYLLEARWWKGRLEPKELRDFRGKVESKAANVLGLCVAVNGFTEGAIVTQSVGTPLILMDGSDLMAVLEGRIALPDLLEAKRRHAAETGNPMYPVRDIV